METNKKDEHIQRWLERHTEDSGTSDDLINQDVKTYQLVFGALKQEPEEGLSYGLSYRVQRLIFKRKEESRQKLLYGLLVFVVGLLIAGIVVIARYPSLFNFEQILGGIYFWPLCFGALAIAFIQLLDYRSFQKKWMGYRGF